MPEKQLAPMTCQQCGRVVMMKPSVARERKFCSNDCRYLAQTRHGYATTRRHYLYNLWRNIRDRCEKPTDREYPFYGARGITLCDEWRDFATFAAWITANLGPRPDGHSIDRIDSDGNYEPGNLRWADKWTQAVNKQTHRPVTSQHRGVWLDARSGKWQSAIKRRGQKYTVGLFATEQEAADAYQEKARELDARP